MALNCVDHATLIGQVFDQQGAMLQELPSQLRAAEIQSAKRAREIAALTAEARRLSEMVGPLQERANPNPNPNPGANPTPNPNPNSNPDPDPNPGPNPTPNPNPNSNPDPDPDPDPNPDPYSRSAPAVSRLLRG